MFDFDNVIIPLFSAKLNAFKELQSVSFGNSASSTIRTISSKIFRALLSLKVAIAIRWDVVGSGVENELRVSQQPYHFGSQ